VKGQRHSDTTDG